MAQTSWWQQINDALDESRSTDESGPITVKDGVWYRALPNGHYLMGIDQSVIDRLGELTFADFPTKVQEMAVGDDLLDVEGEKSVETLQAPVAGTVISRNQNLLNNIEQASATAPLQNWIMEINPQNN